MEIIRDTPFDYEIVRKNIKQIDPINISLGNTRAIMKMVEQIESDIEAIGLSQKYIRMEIGIPGLNPSQIGLNAEIAALKKNIAGIYPPADGQPALKKEISRFAKLFLNLDIPLVCCIPTVGAINGSYASFMVTCRINKEKDTVLFIDPGFPAHKQLVKMLGFKQDTFDVYNYRGEKLKEKLDEKLSKGNIAAVLYSNPNNPTWICFTDEELKIIGDAANKYDTVIIEDLSYFAMDFRKDYSHPGQPPFQPTVANYTENYILITSSSKSFSYAGQRIGMILLSEKLYYSNYDDLLRYYPTPNFGNCLIFGTILLTTGGVAQSVQFGLAGMLKATNDGDYKFVDEVRIYGKKAEIMKEIFTKNGFKIVYDHDGEQPLADGFYFTVSYPGFRGDELSERLLYYGISSIPLSSTGSERIEGIRACVSLIKMEQMPDLEERLKIFHQHY